MVSFSSFLRYSAPDRRYHDPSKRVLLDTKSGRSEPPRLNLTFESSRILDLDLVDSYPITFKITREEDDSRKEPCIIHWDPIEDGFGRMGIILFQTHEPRTNEMQPIHDDPKRSQANHWSSQEVSASDPCFKELSPGDTVSWEVPLPPVYFNHFRQGQSFKILWAGGKIPLWNWGTLAEHNSCILSPKFPAVVLPGGLYQTLTITTEEAEESDEDVEIPLPPSPSPILPDARVSGAPVLSLSLAGPATLSMKNRNSAGELQYIVTCNLFYEAEPDTTNRQPLTFHTYILRNVDRRYEGFRLYRKEGDRWRPFDDESRFRNCSYWMLSERVTKKVGHNQDEFTSMNPRESWSITREVTKFPQDAANGDVFRYRFKGVQLDWWDWGCLEDHEGTVVRVDGKVQEPRNNGGRPRLMIPASNWVEFSLIE